MALADRPSAEDELHEQKRTLTVQDATYDLLRAYGLTTIFGNVGSTEEPFLKNFPSDFRYILGLQEASAVAMAGGYAQSTRRPVLVNLHTAAGLGNAMGAVLSAFHNKLPLIDLDAIKEAATQAWTKDKPTVLEIPITPEIPPLI